MVQTFRLIPRFIFRYISNKMQRYTVYFIWKLLYMFRVVPPPIIRSANIPFNSSLHILIYIQQDATLHSLFYLETALHVSGSTPPIIRSANIPFNSSLHILIYIQQDATLHNLFYLETALHVSGSTTTHHQERKHSV